MTYRERSRYFRELGRGYHRQYTPAERLAHARLADMRRRVARGALSEEEVPTFEELVAKAASDISGMQAP